MMKLVAGCVLLSLVMGCVVSPSREAQGPSRSAELRVIPLKHAVATEVAGELRALQQSVRVVSDQRTNSLLLMAESPEALAPVIDLIAHLDLDVNGEPVH